MEWLSRYVWYRIGFYTNVVLLKSRRCRCLATLSNLSSGRSGSHTTGTNLMTKEQTETLNERKQQTTHRKSIFKPFGKFTVHTV